MGNSVAARKRAKPDHAEPIDHLQDFQDGKNRHMQERTEQRIIWESLFHISTGEATTIRQLSQRMQEDPLAQKLIQLCVFRLVGAGLLQWRGQDHGHSECPLALTERCLELQSTLGLDIRLLSRISHPGTMAVRPLFGPVIATDDASEIFVIMPFRDTLQHVYDIHIHRAASQLGLSVSRGDRWRQDQDIVQNIWHAICSSRLVIADCTNNNPNVFYEIGIAHSVGIPVVLITQDSASMPHDCRHLRHISYSNTAQGLDALESALMEAIRKTLSIPAP